MLWLIAGDGAGFSPANLELLAVENELFDRGIGVEFGCCGTAEEGGKNAGFFWENTNRLEGTTMDKVEQFVDGDGSREVSDVDDASCGFGDAVRAIEQRESRRLWKRQLGRRGC